MILFLFFSHSSNLAQEDDSDSGSDSESEVEEMGSMEIEREKSPALSEIRFQEQEKESRKFKAGQQTSAQRIARRKSDASTVNAMLDHLQKLAATEKALANQKPQERTADDHFGMLHPLPFFHQHHFIFKQTDVNFF